MNLPKNITQIGEANQRCRVYVEDYVFSYIKQINRQAENRSITVALYGTAREENEVSYIFFYGACRIQSVQKEVRHLSQAQNQEVEKLRIRYFPELNFLGYKILDGDMVEGFHVCEQGICRYISGYACFYEKNEAMLAYMLETRGEEAAPESVDREKYERVRLRQEERKAQYGRTRRADAGTEDVLQKKTEEKGKTAAQGSGERAEERKENTEDRTEEELGERTAERRGTEEGLGERTAGRSGRTSEKLRRRTAERKRRETQEKREGKTRQRSKSPAAFSVRTAKTAAAAAFFVLCVIGIAAMNDVRSLKDVQVAAGKLLAEFGERKLPDSDEQQGQTNTLVAEEKLADLIKQENNGYQNTGEILEPGSVQEETLSAGQPQEQTAQEQNAQEQNAPEHPAPEQNAPEQIAPEQNVPEQNVSEQNMPESQPADLGQPAGEKQGNGEGEKQSPEVSVSQPDSYTVKRGDTLTAISIRVYGTDKKVKEICELNGIGNPDDIRYGQKILLP